MTKAGAGKLKANALGLFGAAALGAVMMSPALGIYGNFGPMALSTGKAAPLVYLLSLLATLPTALCYALISREIPSSGSVYTWLWEAVNPVLGVWIGWILLGFFSIVVFLQPLLFCLFFNDLIKFFGMTPGYGSLVISLTISSAAVAAMTYRGINISEKSSLLDLLLQMLIVATLAITILIVLASKGKLDFAPFLPSSASQGFSGLTQAMVFGILSFVGFGVISNVAEETENPRKAIPIAIVVACIVVGFYWIVVSWAYVIAVPTEQIISCVQRDIIPVVPIAKQYWGTGDIIIVVTGMVAALGVYIATVVGTSRVFYAMGRDGAIPEFFGAVNKSHQTPWNALHPTFLLTFIFVLLPARFIGIYNAYIWWGKAVVFFAVTIYLFVSIANPIFYFRFRRSQFNIFSNGLLPLISLLINLYLLYKAFFIECWNSSWAMGKSVIVFAMLWLLLGTMYVLWMRKHRPALFKKKAHYLRDDSIA